MPRRVSRVSLVAWLAGIPLSAAQQPNQPPAPQPSSNVQVTPAATEPAKPKKVWTNENLGEAGGTISVVGDPKNASTGAARGRPADVRFIDETRKQLQKLRKDIDDDDKQILALKNFVEGEGSGQADRQLHKGYSSQPVPQQITALEAKKKDAQAKIDQLLDEARRRGVQPGDLR
jgi:hypothetical protein